MAKRRSRKSAGRPAGKPNSLKRSVHQLARDRALIAEYRLQGFNNVEILDMVNKENKDVTPYELTLGNVQNDIAWIKKNYHERVADSMGVFVAQQLDALQMVMKCQWQLYYEAKAAKPFVEKKTLTTIQEIEDPEGDTIVTDEGIEPKMIKKPVPYAVEFKEKVFNWRDECAKRLNDIRGTIVEMSKLMNDSIRLYLEREADKLAAEEARVNSIAGKVVMNPMVIEEIEEVEFIDDLEDDFGPVPDVVQPKYIKE